MEQLAQIIERTFTQEIKEKDFYFASNDIGENKGYFTIEMLNLELQIEVVVNAKLVSYNFVDYLNEPDGVIEKEITEINVEMWSESGKEYEVSDNLYKLIKKQVEI